MNLQQIFSCEAVTPEALLSARSERARRQRELLPTGGSCLISFTLNIPGPVKQFPLARAAFEEGLAALETSFGSALRLRYCGHSAAGSEAILELPLPAGEGKARCCRIEESHPLGRFFDMDVLNEDGLPLSRTELGKVPRACLLCGGNAKLCARSGAHSLEALRCHTVSALNAYFREKHALRFAQCALRALLTEVSVTPKPGLVDRANNGSHSDMDFFSFMDSAAVLSGSFHSMFCAGWDACGEDPDLLFDKLNYLGLQAEADMLSATGGVNTHKGLLFSLGAVCGAAGALQARAAEPVRLDELIGLCRALGERALTVSGSPAAGARGELAAGFPRVFSVGLAALRRYLASGLSLNDASALTLLALIAETEDTNMLRRGGEALAQQCRARARELLESVPEKELLPVLPELDGFYRRHKLSPGGSADLLCLTLAFYFAQQEGLVR